MTLSLVQSMLLGAGDISQDSLTTWVVGAVMAGVMAVLGFLVRNAFGKVETGLEGLGKKLDDMSAAFARADGDRRVLEARLEAIIARLDKVERELKELSEGGSR